MRRANGVASVAVGGAAAVVAGAWASRPRSGLHLRHKGRLGIQGRRAIAPLQQDPTTKASVAVASAPIGPGHDYKVELVQGKGLGCIALRDIAPGECVLREPAAVKFVDSDPAWIANAKQQMETLPLAEQELVMSLMDCRDPPKSLAGIIITNNYSLGLGSSSGGLFVELSRFNHSCRPNCEQSWDDAAQEIQVYASEAIQAGEEMCTYFVDPRMPRPDRQETFKQVYRFTCVCPACSGDDAERDPARAELLRIGGQIKRLGGRDPTRGVQLVREMLDVYRRDGITAKSFWTDACYHACQLSLLSGDVSGAQDWARQALHWSRVCHGPQHGETLRLLRLSEHPEDHKVVLAWDV